MLELIFTVLILILIGKVLWLAVRMSWGFFKVVLFLVALPLTLVAMAGAGLIALALPILIVSGLVAMLVKA